MLPLPELIPAKSAEEEECDEMIIEYLSKRMNIVKERARQVVALRPSSGPTVAVWRAYCALMAGKRRLTEAARQGSSGSCGCGADNCTAASAIRKLEQSEAAERTAHRTLEETTWVLIAHLHTALLERRRQRIAALRPPVEAFGVFLLPEGGLPPRTRLSESRAGAPLTLPGPEPVDEQVIEYVSKRMRVTAEYARRVVRARPTAGPTVTVWRAYCALVARKERHRMPRKQEEGGKAEAGPDQPRDYVTPVAGIPGGGKRCSAACEAAPGPQAIAAAEVSARAAVAHAELLERSQLLHPHVAWRLLCLCRQQRRRWSVPLDLPSEAESEVALAPVDPQRYSPGLGHRVAAVRLLTGVKPKCNFEVTA
eukprot:EG_transcript_13952